MAENKQNGFRQPKMISFQLGYKATSADRTGGLSIEMWNNMVTLSFYKFGEPMPENRANKYSMGISHLYYFNAMLAKMVLAREEDWLLIADGKKPVNGNFSVTLPHMIFNKEMNAYQEAGRLTLGLIEHEGATKVVLTLEKLGSSYSMIFDRRSLDGDGSIIGLEMQSNPDDVPLKILSSMIMNIVQMGPWLYNLGNKIATYNSGGGSYRRSNGGSYKNYNNNSNDGPRDTDDNIPF